MIRTTDSADVDHVPNPLTQLTLDHLRRRTSMKWRAYPQDVLPLWVAEMDVPQAPAVVEAVRRALDLGDTGYPAGTQYAEALASFAADRWGFDGIDVARTAIVPDVMMGITEVLRLITEPGDVVVVTAPVYPPFYAFTTNAGRRIREARLGADGRLDLAALDEAFAAARRESAHPVLLLSNPHNPSGVVHTRAELEAAATLARRHGVRIISDEIHAPLVLPGAKFTPLLSVAGAENSITVTSASKAWNLAGLKAALAIAGPEAAADLARLPEEVSHGPSHIGILAHTAALTGGRDWLDALIAGLDENRRYLTEAIPRHLPGAVYRPGEATFLAWIDCSGLPIEPAPDGAGEVGEIAGPAKFFVENAQVALSSGHVFGTGGGAFVRLNFATSPAILTEAVERMGAALARLG